MPKKKTPPLSSEEQRKRFEEAARRLGGLPTVEQFKRLVGRIAVAKERKGKPKLK